MEKQRTLMFLLLIVLGAGLLAYGLHSNAAVVVADNQGQDQVQVQPTSEAAVTQEVAQSGATQGEVDQAKKAPAETKKAPACPT